MRKFEMMRTTVDRTLCNFGLLELNRRKTAAQSLKNMKLELDHRKNSKLCKTCKPDVSLAIS
jgi:hypothetical protein